MDIENQGCSTYNGGITAGYVIRRILRRASRNLLKKEHGNILEVVKLGGGAR